MNLEQRYEAATGNSYVARVKATQVASVGVRQGVDFMDAGAPKGTAADSMQSNFQRRASEDKVVTQGGDDTKTYAANQLKGSSRWFGRALNYAFTDPSSATSGLVSSQWTLYKSLRVGTKDAWTDNPNGFRRWTPATTFNISATLSELAKTRATGKRAAPTSR